MCLDVAEYGVRSAVETISAMVKLAFELSLVCETREVEVLESYEQGADTSRAHSLVIEVCEGNVSAKYQRGTGSDVSGDVEMNQQNGSDPGGPGRT